MLTLDHLNACDAAAFVAALGDVFEHAPWVADAIVATRPFATVTALHDAMMAAVRNTPADTQLAFIRAHPELGSKVRRVDMTADSQAEQGSLGLDRLSDSEFQRFHALNAAYRDRFVKATKWQFSIMQGISTLLATGDLYPAAILYANLLICVVPAGLEPNAINSPQAPVGVTASLSM